MGKKSGKLMHSGDVRRYTELMIEERMLLNQTTFGDGEEISRDMVDLFADRYEESVTAPEYNSLKAVKAEKMEVPPLLRPKREGLTILLRAFEMDKWAESSRFPYENPLQILIETDDPLFMLDEYDALNFAGDELAQNLFTYLDNVKSGKIKEWDEAERVNCFGDDGIAAMSASSAAKTIRDILLPEEKKLILLQKTRQNLEAKLASYGLTILDIAKEIQNHESRWINVSLETCLVELEGVLRKLEFSAKGYFSLLPMEICHRTVDWGLAQNACSRFGAVATTAAGYFIFKRPGILKQIKDESFLNYVAALIGAGCARVAHKDRDEQEKLYPEKFRRIPDTLQMFTQRVTHLRECELKRRAEAALSANAKMNTEK